MPDNFMKKTNLQLINFINFARLYMAKHSEATKFRHALERMEKRAVKLHEPVAAKQADLNIEHAATEGEGGPVLTDSEGRFRYTKDGIRARNKAQKALLETAVEIEPYFATELPKEALTPAEKEACSGFVIPEEPDTDAAREGDGEQQQQEQT